MRSTPHTRIDAGLGQINLGYHQQRYSTACDLLDPYRNLAIAAEILKERHHPGEDWLVAVGSYHRPAGGEPAARYRRSVSAPRPRAGCALNHCGVRRAPGDLPMTKSHLAHLTFKGLLMLLTILPLASRAGVPLIVVEDRGGASALPYYEALNLQPCGTTVQRGRPSRCRRFPRHPRMRLRCCRCAAPSSRPAPSRDG
ncbi:hypothetical protein SSTU70S_03725 [Stutzerimonas stutzeri]